MYRGKKFNATKELIKGEDYLGIRKFRFYIKCVVCSQEIVFKTDPKNSDYEMESGASRNFELWRDTKEAIEEAKQQREDEDKLDSMKSLENRTLDSKIEMDVLDALDEMKAINQRHEKVDTNHLLEKLAEKVGKEAKDKEEQEASTSSSSSKVMANGLTEEDEKLVQSIKFRGKYKEFDDADDDVDTGGADTLSSVVGSGSASSSFADNVMKQLRKEKIMEKAGTKAPVVVIKKRKIDVASANDGNRNSAGHDNRSSNREKQLKVAGGEAHGADQKPESNAKQTSAPANAMTSLLGDYGGSDSD
jgi:hypothetical protein